jgi:RNA polymerase sigma factor (sigma-70 family)
LKHSGDPSSLWLSFTKGNEEAFTAIYSTYVEALHEYGMRMLKDEEQVGDCIHDLFIKLWLNHKTIGKTDNIRFYLFGALRNTIISYKAKEDRLLKDGFHNPDDFVLDFDAESAQIKKEESLAQSHKIKDALDQLTGRQKEIIYLKYFEEMTYDQISDLMNISVKSAYKLSARALDALKILMNADKAMIIWMLMHYKSQLF